MAARWSGASWGQPTGHDLLELLGRHAGVGGHDELNQSVHACCGEGLLVILEHGLEGLLGRPLRMLRSERLNPIDGEEKLEVKWLLGPQGAVVVEGGDPLGLGDEIGTRRVGDPADEIEDRLLSFSVVPGR